jgi:cell wall-associated NlpC family hydrolase
MTLLTHKALVLFLILILSGCSISRSIHQRDSNTKAMILVAEARKILGVKYKVGGNSPQGFDCSGLVWWVYKQNGVNLERIAAKQFKQGRVVKKNELQIADLVFFRTSGSRVSHVGIYTGKGFFIHAPGRRKKVEEISFNNKYWQDRYAGARRILP